MATEQDTKELSMAEILSSIRKILEENETEKKSVRAEEKEDEILELNSSMIVDDTPQSVPDFVARDKRIFPSTLPQEEESRNTIQIADEEPSPYDMMQETKISQEPQVCVSSKADILNHTSKDNPEISNVSEDIVNSFTKMFEKNDFGYHKNVSSFDAEALLKQIIGKAVEERLDNRVLLNMVKETVIPVLETWLSCYLPKLVAEEVQRVMAKAGKR